MWSTFYRCALDAMNVMMLWCYDAMLSSLFYVLLKILPITIATMSFVTIRISPTTAVDEWYQVFLYVSMNAGYPADWGTLNPCLLVALLGPEIIDNVCYHTVLRLLHFPYMGHPRVEGSLHCLCDLAGLTRVYGAGVLGSRVNPGILVCRARHCRFPRHHWMTPSS